MVCKSIKVEAKQSKIARDLQLVVKCYFEKGNLGRCLKFTPWYPRITQSM